MEESITWFGWHGSCSAQVGPWNGGVHIHWNWVPDGIQIPFLHLI